MTYDSSDDSSYDGYVPPNKKVGNDTAVTASRHIGGMDITKTVDDDEYMAERVRRERAFQWHSRWALPTYKEMKAQVRKAKGNLDITEDDVDLLPWGPGGMLNRREYERLQRGESTQAPRRQKRPPTTMTLQVQLPNGSTLELDGIKADHDTAADLRAKIQQKEPMLEAKRQVLSKDGTKLPVGETCQEMGLENGDTIQLQMKKVPVSVTNQATGQEVTVLVDTSLPILQIKKDLQSSMKIPVDNQILYKNGEELQNDQPAAAYGIQGGSKLDLSPNTFPVKVRMPDGTKVTIEIAPAHTTEDIKDAIAQKTGMEPSRQVLKKNDNGKELPSGKSALQMGLQQGDELVVETLKVPITVRTMDGEEIQVHVDPKGTTVKELKQMLEPETDIPVSQQRLVHAKKQKELSSNGKVLADYGVKKGTVLELEPTSMTVHVEMPDGRQVPVDITPSDTAQNIKDKIEDQTGMSADKQNLLKEGRELPNGQSAKDMGLRPGDHLQVTPKEITVNVSMPDGSQVPVDIKPSDTSDDIKRKIEKQTGLEAPRQVLKKDGSELGNGQTAQDLGLQEGDDLEVDLKQVPITVRTMDGKQVQVLVDPLGDTMGDIKAKLAQENDHLPPAHNQALFKDGRELDNDRKKAHDYGIQEGTVLDLEPKSMQVQVEMPDGSQVPVQISPSDTSDQIKNKIEQKTGMKAAKQVLKQDGNELPDRKAARDMGLREGDNLQVSPREMTVNVSMPDGSKVPVDIKPSDTAQDIKKKIERKTGMEAPRQVLKDSNGRELPDQGETAQDMGLQEGDDLEVEIKQVPISVRTMDGNRVKVMVDPYGDSIMDIKEKVANESSNVPPAHNQKLFKDGRELDNDHKKAKEYGIKEGTVLDLEPKSMQVKVEMPDGSRVPVDISPSDTADDIKNKIEDQTGMSADKQVLNKNGRELPDGRTAKDMGLRDGDNLQVKPKEITVNVAMPDGSQVPVDIKPSDTSDDIKRKIEQKTGMEAPRQVLKDSNGRELPNGRTAENMGLQEGDDLQVGIKQVPIKVRTMDGDEIKIMVDPIGDSIGDIKDKLEGKSGIPSHNQKLFKDGRELDNDRKKADDYGIKEGTVLDLEPKSLKLSVLMPDGRKVPVEIDPSDDARDIKKQIEKKTGMPVGKQVLKMYGDELPNNKSAKDMGLRDGDDNLEVETLKVPVTVNLPNGRSVDIMVDPDEKLEQIKHDLEPESGIPVRNQNLYKSGKLLDDNYKNAGDYGIKAGTVLDLEDEEERRRRQEEEDRRREEEEEEARRAKEEAAARKKRNAAKSNRPPPVTMGDEPLERAYRWYTRIQAPHYNGMCEMVRTSPGIDITVEHVNLLPWIKKGKLLDFPLLREMLEKIVADRKARGLPF